MNPVVRRAGAAVAGCLAGAVVAGGGLAVWADADASLGLRGAVAQQAQEGPAQVPVRAGSAEQRVPERERTPAPAVPPVEARSAPAPVAEPAAVALPRQGIRSALDRLQLQPDGQLEAPPRWDVAGWYVDGPRPGQRGPAVIAGHVDGPDGPAVFWRLEQVRPGDPVEVTRADGTSAVFAVTRTLVVPKSGFPTGEVYGPTPHAELRLITCTGPFDRRSGHYVDNLIVFATEVLP